ncbi:MAG: hypothetical protein K5769_10080 [Pseudobutyrivibrio sp.]|nr:hypothetical protein [Pseudobutyrivibrio sp.]
MKKRNLLVGALMLGAATVAVGATTVNADAQTVQEAQQTPQAAKEAIQYGQLTKEQKDMIASMFDAKFYASQNSDVAAACNGDEAALLNHFCDKGIWEGRVGCPEFDPFAYACLDDGARAAFKNNLIAYYQDYYNHLQAGADKKYNTTFNKCYKSRAIIEYTLKSTFGDNQLIDNVLKRLALPVAGSGGGGGAVQAGPIINAEQPVVLVPVEDTPTVSTLQKCKDLKYAGEVTYNGNSFYFFYVVNTDKGYDLFAEAENAANVNGAITFSDYYGVDYSYGNNIILIDSTYAKDASGNIDVSKSGEFQGLAKEISVGVVVCDEQSTSAATKADYESYYGNYSESGRLLGVNDRFVTTVSYENKSDPILANGINSYGYGLVIKNETIETTGEHGGWSVAMEEQDSLGVDYAVDTQATDATKYSVTGGIKQNEDGTVGVTIGVYNDDGFAFLDDYTLEKIN